MRKDNEHEAGPHDRLPASPLLDGIDNSGPLGSLNALSKNPQTLSNPLDAARQEPKKDHDVNDDAEDLTLTISTRREPRTDHDDRDLDNPASNASYEDDDHDDRGVAWSRTTHRSREDHEEQQPRGKESYRQQRAREREEIKRKAASGILDFAGGGDVGFTPHDLGDKEERYTLNPRDLAGQSDNSYAQLASSIPTRKEAKKNRQAAKERSKGPQGKDRGKLEKALDETDRITGLDSKKTGSNLLAGYFSAGKGSDLYEAGIDLAFQQERKIKRTKRLAITGIGVLFAVMLLAPLTGSGTDGEIALPKDDQGNNTECSPTIISTGSQTATGAINRYPKEALGNAKVIYDTGKSLSVPDYGIVIALATAIQESTLQNLAGGDRDSLGLFQQRPSMGWGTREEILDPVYASTKFYQGLLKVNGWENMPLTQAAQAVQRSGYPDAYAAREADAKEFFEAVSGGSFAFPSDACTEAQGSLEALPADKEAALDLTRDALEIARAAHHVHGVELGNILGRATRANNPTSDHATGNAVDLMIPNYTTPTSITFGDNMAEWYRKHFKEFGINYIIWRGKIWLAPSPDKPHTANEWKAYSHPSGATDDNNMHYNHLHISVVVPGTTGTGYGVSTEQGDVKGGWALPINANWRMTSKYGSRLHPITGTCKLHAGLDMAYSNNSKIFSAGPGVVLSVGWSGTGGNMVQIRHTNGTITKYLHLNSTLVKAGDTVQAGTPIGLEGATGGVTGVHLHFEVYKNGQPINPGQWLKDVGLIATAIPAQNGC